jgi:hypothetical protein
MLLAALAAGGPILTRTFGSERENWMRRRNLLYLGAILLLVGFPAGANAQTINLTVNDPNFGVANQTDGPTGSPATFMHDLAIQNGDNVTIFIETGTPVGGLTFAGPSGGVTLDDSAFQAFLATEPSLTAGNNTTVTNAFIINVAAGAAAGIYTKTVNVLGGDTNEEQTLIGVINFEVQVTAPDTGGGIPEGNSLAILMGGLPALGGLLMSRRKLGKGGLRNLRSLPQAVVSRLRRK